MPNGTISPPGDKMKKAVLAFCELLRENPQKSRGQLLQEVALTFDLSPSESLFLERHLENEEPHQTIDKEKNN
jgi:hypothetical protein